MHRSIVYEKILYEEEENFEHYIDSKASKSTSCYSFSDVCSIYNTNITNNSNVGCDEGDVGVSKAFNDAGEATVLEETDEIKEIVSEQTRRTKVKRRTSSTIRKIQDIIKQEQLKDFLGANHNQELPISVAPVVPAKYPVTKTAGLAYKSNYRQRSKSRTSHVRGTSFDQPQRPFRRWLGVSTCVTSDTRFFVESGNGKAAGIRGRNWREAVATLNNKESDRSTEDSGIIDKQQCCSQKQCKDMSTFKKLNETRASIEPSQRITVSNMKGSESMVKMVKMGNPTNQENTVFSSFIDATTGSGKSNNKGDNNAIIPGGRDHECECSPKQIVNVEANEGVIHIHQQTHGSVGSVMNKTGSIRRQVSGISTAALNKSRPESNKPSSAFKSLRRSFKRAHGRHKYVNVLAIKDSEVTLPGQLHYKKGQVIKQMSLDGQHPIDGMCYGYYRTGKLQRKAWGIFPSSHVIPHTETSIIVKHDKICEKSGECSSTKIQN